MIYLCAIKLNVDQIEAISHFFRKYGGLYSIILSKYDLD